MILSRSPGRSHRRFRDPLPPGVRVGHVATRNPEGGQRVLSSKRTLAELSVT